MSQSVAYPGVAVLERAHRPLGPVLLAVLLAAPFLAVMDGFMALVAAPSIRMQLHMSDAGVQLVVAARVVAYAGLLVTGGRLGDIHGRRRLLVAGLGLFSVTSLIAAVAPNQQLLILARTLQGGAAALMYPQALALIHGHFHGRDLARAMAAFGVTLGLAAGTALLVSGILIQADILGLGWRAVFLLNLPVAVTATGMTLVLVPRTVTRKAARLDLVGAALLTSGLFALVFPTTVGRQLGWPAWTWGLLVSAALIGGAFVAHEHRLTERRMAPLLSLQLFRVPGVPVGLLATLALYGGQLPLWLLLTIYLQDGLGLSPMATGLVFSPVALGLLAGSTGAPRLPSRLRGQALTIGTVSVAASACALGACVLSGSDGPHMLALLSILLLAGAGFGMAIPSLVGAVLRFVPGDQAGAASGALVTAQQVAGALGIAVTGVVFFGLLHRSMSYGGAVALTLELDSALFLLSAFLVRGLEG